MKVGELGLEKGETNERSTARNGAHPKGRPTVPSMVPWCVLGLFPFEIDEPCPPDQNLI